MIYTLYFLPDFNPFYVTGPLVFRCFQEVQNDIKGVKKFNYVNCFSCRLVGHFFHFTLLMGILNFTFTVYLFHPNGIYLFKVNNGNIRTMCETCSKLTVKTPERRQLRRSGVFVNFEQILQIIQVFPLLTLNKLMPTGNSLGKYMFKVGTNGNRKMLIDKAKKKSNFAVTRPSLLKSTAPKLFFARI